MVDRNLSSPLTLVWSIDRLGQPASHILTKAFAKHHVAVSLSDRRVLHASYIDVLGGRGKHLDHHPGNVRFADLVTKYKTAYHYGTSSGKRGIVDKILDILLKDENRRFLKLVPYQRDANIWYWIEEPKVRSKISQKLRDSYKFAGLPLLEPGEQHFAHAPTMMSSPGNIPSLLSNQHEAHIQAYVRRAAQEIHVEAQSDASDQNMVSNAAAGSQWLTVATNQAERIVDSSAVQLVGSVKLPPKPNGISYHDGNEALKPNTLGGMLPNEFNAQWFWAQDRSRLEPQPTSECCTNRAARAPNSSLTKARCDLPTEIYTGLFPSSIGYATVSPSKSIPCNIGVPAGLHQEHDASLTEAPNVLHVDNLRGSLNDASLTEAPNVLHVDNLFGSLKASPNTTAKGVDSNISLPVPLEQRNSNHATRILGGSNCAPVDVPLDKKAPASLFEEVPNFIPIHEDQPSTTPHEASLSLDGFTFSLFD